MIINLSPTHGREQAGLGTDARKVPRDYPTNVRVTAKETGPARFFDPKTHRPNLAGTIPPARMAKVEGALRLVLN